MKASRIALTAALIALAACSHKEIVDNGAGNDGENGGENSGGNVEYSESYYASHAVVDSYDTRYESGDGGGTVTFGKAGGTVVLNVDCGTPWTAENHASDLFEVTADSSAGSVTVTAGENSSEEDLNGTFTLKTTGSGIEFATVSVVQLAGVRLTLSTSFAALTSNGSSVKVDVESNCDWDYDYDESAGWFTVSRSGDRLTVTATAAPTEGEVLRSEVAVTASYGDETAEAAISVSLYEAGDAAMILEYTIPSGGSEVVLPLTGEVDCTVDWGDGSSIQTVKSEFPSHRFKSAGVYDVSIAGTVTEMRGDDYYDNLTPNTTLTAIVQWGDIGLTSLYRAFAFNTSLSSIPLDKLGSFARITNFDYTFYRTGLTEVPAGLFDTCRDVTSFFGTFYWNSITSVPDYLFRGLDKVTDFSYVFGGNPSLRTVGEGIFDGCTAAETFRYAFSESILDSISGKIFKDCTAADDFSYMFSSCTFSEIPWDIFDYCPSVTKFAATFINCRGITNVPEWIFQNCPNATTFQSVFYDCRNLTTIPENLFSKNPENTSFYMAFQYCSSLEAIPAGLFDNCPKVENVKQCFDQCTSLTEIPAGLFDAMTGITAMPSMFMQDTGITSIPKDLFAKNTEVTDFSQAFYACSGLTSVPAGLFDHNTKVDNFRAMFSGCRGLTGESPYTTVDGTKVHLYERNEDNGFTIPTTFSTCFLACTGLSDYYSIPSNWGGGSSSTTSLSQTSADGPAWEIATDVEKIDTPEEVWRMN